MGSVLVRMEPSHTVPETACSDGGDIGKFLFIIRTSA